nr:YaiI/YqxD family protein [uncultured Bacillus sp.]
MGKPVIYVDADSCPVKEEIVENADEKGIEVFFIASYAHVKSDVNNMKWVYVDTSKEAADLYIMNHVKAGDLVITQDIGLASTLLLKGVYVLSPRGSLYEENSIHTALDMRYLAAKARKRGIYGKGPKSFSKQDRENFVQELSKILTKFEGN